MKKEIVKRTLALLLGLSLIAIPKFAESRDICYWEEDECFPFFFEASYIYWCPCENGLPIGYKFNESVVLTDNDQTTTTTRNFSRQLLPFDCCSGFKLGIGYMLEPCEWLASVRWTYYDHNTNKTLDNEKLAANEFLGDVWNLRGIEFTPLGNISKIKGKWDLCINLVDFDLEKSVFCRGCFEFRPNIGIRYASVDQNFKVEIDQEFVLNETTTTTNSKMKLNTDFWGVGPRVGFLASWDVGCDISLYGSTAASLLYGETDYSFKNDGQAVTVTGTSVPLTTTDIFFVKNGYDECCLRPILDLGFGATWSTCFCEDYEFSLALGWELHYLFNQNRIHHPDEEVVALSGIRRNGDLSIHGLTLTARIEL